jgi:hypothetical protein
VAVAISAAYLAIGLRMGAPGVVYLARFGQLKAEFHRYRYQLIRWADAGWKGERVPMQLEIYLQGLANASVLALPALLDVGLWRYSRHPNYFFQWMGWNALVLAAAPALASVAEGWPAPRAIAVGLALLGASGFMYWTLVHFTGIAPAEHYSAQKRPGYAEYQHTTQRFFPGPPRSSWWPRRGAAVESRVK